MAQTSVYADLFTQNVYRFCHYMDGQIGGNYDKICHPVSVVVVMFWLKGTAFREGQAVPHD